MSVIPQFPPRPVVAAVKPAPKVRTLEMDSLTVNGVWAFICCFAVYLSSIRAARLEIAGLLIQPYLIPVGLMTPFLILSRLERLPVRATALLISFTGIYVLSNIGTSWFVSESVKLVSFVVCLLATAMLIRSRADFVAGAMGLIVAVGLMALKGFAAEGSLEGGDVADAALEGVGNKNAYSLYALPAVLLAGYFLLRFRGGTFTRLCKLIALASICYVLAAVLASGNRSGFLGLVMVGLALLWDRKVVGLVFVAVISVGITSWLISTNRLEKLVAKYDETVESTTDESKDKGDRKRFTIMTTSIEIALQHPILGISPEAATVEFAKASGDNNMSSLDSHDVYANVLAGSGLICFATLIGWYWCIARCSGPNRSLLQADPSGRIAMWICRWMILLLAFRSVFARETLYTPGFCFGIGLVMGLAQIEVERLKKIRPNYAVATNRGPLRPSPGRLQ